MRKNQCAVSDEEILAALMAHSTIKEAAAVVGLSERAIYDRMHDGDFQADYIEAKNDILRKALFSLNERVSGAIDTLTAIMNDPAAAQAVRVQAAQAILSHSLRFTDRLSREEERSADASKGPFGF